MLTYRLIHPELLGALASVGHGSQVLIADGNFPLRTAMHPAARAVYLNLAPGLLTVEQVLEVLQDACNFESGVLMRSPEPAPVHDIYRSMLGSDVPIEYAGREEFYDLARSVETGLVIATGDQRLYANILLTVGVR
jgi:L-fucose mutarotase